MYSNLLAIGSRLKRGIGAGVGKGEGWKVLLDLLVGLGWSNLGLSGALLAYFHLYRALQPIPAVRVFGFQTQPFLGVFGG